MDLKKKQRDETNWKKSSNKTEIRWKIISVISVWNGVSWDSWNQESGVAQNRFLNLKSASIILKTQTM